jgi:type II secretory pathway predicted ATPase ExeA
LFQRIGVYCHLSKIESLELMRDYIEHRLERAGVSRRIFTDDAYDAIWEYSESGVPRLINKIAKLALKAGQTQALI